MSHAQRCEAVAYAYARPLEDVQRWPVGVVTAFWRNACTRGLLTPEVAP